MPPASVPMDDVIVSSGSNNNGDRSEESNALLQREKSKSMFARTRMVPQRESPSLLEEAMDYAALTMLLNFFALFRERSALGFTQVLFHNLRVGVQDMKSPDHSEHDTVRTAVSIFRLILQELEYEATNYSKDHDIAAHSALAKEFVEWIQDSRVKGTDIMAKTAIQKLRSHVARTRWKRLYNVVCAYNRMKKLGFAVPMIGRDDPTPVEAMKPVATPTLGALTEVEEEEHAPDDGKSDSPKTIMMQTKRLRQASGSLSDSWFTNQMKMVEDHFAEDDDMEGDDPPEEKPTGEARRFSMKNRRQESEGLMQPTSHAPPPRKSAIERHASEGVFAISAQKRLKTYKPNRALINKSIEDSLKAAFREDSFAARLIHLKEEVIVVDDQNATDVVYYICVNEHTNTVNVIFRGIASAQNWLSAFHTGSTEYDNPVPYGDEVDTSGRSAKLSFFTDYSVHLLRPRRDDEQGRNKLKQILDLVHEIGTSLLRESNITNDPNKYKLTVIGHGVGAALATIFSFYAACDERVLTMGPVRVFTYASPRVGDHRFMRAYRQMERNGRVLHARFCNQHDPATVWPVGYQHVGMQVRLHGVDFIGELLMQSGLYISYPKDDGWGGSLVRSLANNILVQLSTPGDIAKNHRLSEYYRRLDATKRHYMELMKAEIFVEDTEDAIKSLEWYYLTIAGIPNMVAKKGLFLDKAGADEDDEDRLHELITCLAPFHVREEGQKS